MGTTLVTITDIDDRKKWLVGLPFFPAIDGPFASTDIPGVIVITATDIVIGLTRVRGVIAGLSQQVGIIGDPVVRNFITAPHRLSAVGDTIHTGDPARTSRSTYGSIIEAETISKSISGKLIYIRSPGVGASIRTHPGNAVVLAGNPENVGPFCGEGRSGKQENA